MTLGAFEEFVFGAVLLDWDAEGEKMRRIAIASTRPRRCGSSADGTDLTLSLAGRTGAVDDGHVNMPGGEVFFAPVEESAEGVITFSEFPAVRFGREVAGARLAFEGGRVVDASAASNEAFLRRDARPRRGRAQARRARDRLQPRDPAVLAEPRLRREDRRHDPPRPRQLLLLHRRPERERDPLGHRQGPPERRPPVRRRRARPGGGRAGFCERRPSSLEVDVHRDEAPVRDPGEDVLARPCGPG